MLRRSSAGLASRPLIHPCADPERSFALGRGIFPYFVKPVPRNRFAFLEHDGVSDGYLQGFRAKEVGWLYRWRHNLNPQCNAVGMTNATNPTTIQVHWLENKTTTKLSVALFNDDGLPHVTLWLAIVAFAIWHCSRYIFYHPEVTLWNIVWPANRIYTEYVRFSKLHPMDAPVFRWFQGQNEFYACNSYREYVKRGIVVNDPWVEKCKEDGVFDQLLLYPNELKGHVWPPKKKTAEHH
ncbi:hypothetical protein XU18_2219 [Perkinsela sp. CCAP 1560/4]|nr:hypothetical protein XU18_2219 [Perkinsela sp. CCAP 1560/4]|eukprot:KNH07042.1 hypothetical protein XU18_2219 [Perkinsela sp. CCAP 1560/4]